MKFVALAGVGLMLVVAGVCHFSKSESKQEIRQTQQTETAELAPRPTAPSTTGTEVAPATVPLAGREDSASVGGAVTGLVLQVAAMERTWIAVDADGQTVLRRLMNSNEIENLKAHDSFDVTVGNAQGAVLTLNGETQKPLGRRGEVKSVHLTCQDLRNPLSDVHTPTLQVQR
jgi:hypothetical protein